MLWPYTDGLARHVVLPSLDEVALDHRAEDAATTRGHLLADRRGDRDLLLRVVLLAVAVRAVDHHRSGSCFAASCAQTSLTCSAVVVRAGARRRRAG